MFLKSLTLKGFKSFAETTTLEFEPGVTVVVGPNGSGKSNVVDAVAWVLGAQSPKTVRSSKMEDVIFAGTPKRAALGRAEVELTIDNSAGLLPIDFSEVTISRTLFRTGDSDYAINRVPCRLLDVVELLSDTGVGRQQHVIVSQGNLDAVLSSRAEDRRLVIEEAAGILKFRRRKERAERRLESTEASLVRLQDLLREVRRQLRPLEKQAEAARRHGDLATELESLRRHLAGRELATIEARLAGAARGRSELGRAEAALRRALQDFDVSVIAEETELSAATDAQRSADLAESLSRAESLRAKAQGLLAVLTERNRSVGRDLDAAADTGVVASLEAEAASLRARLEGTENEAAALGPEEVEVDEAEAALAVERAEVERRWDRDAPRPADPSAEVRAELSALRTAAERSRAEDRRIDERVAATGARVARLGDEVERLVGHKAAAEAEEAALRAAADAAVERLAAAEAAQSGAEEAARVADADAHRWSARAEALAQALNQARARAGAERLTGVAGVVGTLLELIDIDDGFENAFEAAAGEVLAAVVVDDAAAARRSLEHLRDHDGGGAVVALSAPAGASGPPAVADPGDVTGSTPLRGRVRARLPGVTELLDIILARSVVVDGGWQAAIDLAVARPDLVVVTPAGDRFARGLWRVGTSATGATGASLDEARAAAESTAATAARDRDRLRAAKDAAAVARREANDARRAVEANRERSRSVEADLIRAGTDLAALESDAANAAALKTDTEARLAGEVARVAELEQILPGLEAAARADAEAALAERAARGRLADRAAAVAALRRDFEVRIAGLEERRKLTASRLEQVELRLERNVVERDTAASRREALETTRAHLGRLTGMVKARERALAAAVDYLRQARREEAEATRALSERLENLRRQRAAAERQLGELRERTARIDLDETDAKVRLEALVEVVRRDLDIEVDATRDAPCPPLPVGTSAPGRRTELERELRLMGPINPMALEEHTALQERHGFLEAQLEDVRSARRDLSKIIRAVDTEIVDVFRAAYTDVAENFEELFATLFPGGQGRLRLTEPEHLLDTGIEVEARPSGKNVRRLSLLSGGERSLTAMAFLFAVFRSRPSPFYLMDEVEAALDDVNLHRFLHLIDGFRDEAQLVIVSHQKRTMEAADCLYGVTMAPGGSSRVVSERVASPGMPVTP
ncbi:MAG TPA: chromosome segregation protein SMC [Actinomycetota bacterium]|nr:chromosome segregation protein SMC [Actinomycetota bacterium]